MFRLFEGNFGSAFGNLANNPSSSSNGAQNGVFGVNGDGGVADNSNTKVQNAVVATLHGTSKNEYGTNTIGYGFASLFYIKLIKTHITSMAEIKNMAVCRNMSIKYVQFIHFNQRYI